MVKRIIDTDLDIGVIIRAGYFSVTSAPHNVGSLRVGGEETLCFIET